MAAFSLRARCAFLMVAAGLMLLAAVAPAQAQYSQGEPLLPPGRGTLKVSGGDPHYLLALGQEGLSTSIEIEVALYLDTSCTVTIDGVQYRGRVARDEASGALGCEITRDTDNRLPRGLQIFAESSGSFLVARDTETRRTLLVFQGWGSAIDQLFMEYWESMERLGIIF